MTFVAYAFLALAAIPFIYYLLSLYSTVRYFRTSRTDAAPDADFTPPISCLKPVKGLDAEAYENYASFCLQDYPDYEIVFCVDPGDPTLPVLEKLDPRFSPAPYPPAVRLRPRCSKRQSRAPHAPGR